MLSIELVIVKNLLFLPLADPESPFRTLRGEYPPKSFAYV